jgi:hypothetical protein
MTEVADIHSSMLRMRRGSLDYPPMSTTAIRLPANNGWLLGKSLKKAFSASGKSTEEGQPPLLRLRQIKA